MFKTLRAGSAPALASGFGALLVAFGCAVHQGVDRLPNGDLHVACSGSLANCLVRVAEHCPEHGYDVVTGSEHREETGAPPEQQEILRSEATVRCRKSVPLFGRDPNKPSAPSVVVVTASASAAPSGPPRCVPGVSQACTMTTGCSGAQVCVADGSHFGPCECAAAAASPPATSTVTDGGAQ
jgi:hypothetical protein